MKIHFALNVLLVSLLLFSIGTSAAAQGKGGKPSPTPTPQVCQTPTSNTNSWTGSGGLDTSFGIGGLVTADVYGDARAVLIQPNDGKIVTVGNGRNPSDPTSDDLLVTRYNTDGSLDTTFGDDDPLDPLFRQLGYTFIRFTPGFVGGRSGAIDAAGNIIVGGAVANYYQTGLARLDPNGRLDPTFGTGGSVQSGLGTLTDMTLQSDGKILVSVDGSTFRVARFNNDGSVDNTFGTGGSVSVSVSGSTKFGGSAYSVATQVVAGEERIVLAGQSSVGRNLPVVFALTRFIPSGAVDTSFGTNGIVLTAFSGATGVSHIWDHKVDSLKRIVVAGDVNNGGCGGIETAFARYLENGALDVTFSGDGKLTRDVYGGGITSVRAVVIQPDDTIVAAGYANSTDGTYHDSLVVRILENGNPDTSFGPPNFWGGGVVTTRIGTANDWTFAVALQLDGKIVTGGHTDSSGSATLIRYIP